VTIEQKKKIINDAFLLGIDIVDHIAFFQTEDDANFVCECLFRNIDILPYLKEDNSYLSNIKPLIRIEIEKNTDIQKCIWTVLTPRELEQMIMLLEDGENLKVFKSLNLNFSEVISYVRAKSCGKDEEFLNELFSSKLPIPLIDNVLSGKVSIEEAKLLFLKNSF